MTLVTPGLYTADELRAAVDALLEEARKAADPAPKLLLLLLEELPGLAAATAQEAYRVGWQRGFDRGRQAADKKHR